MRSEQAQGMSAHHHKRLFPRQLFQIMLDQPVLHPILTDLPGFPISNQLIGVQGDFKIEVIIDHHLKCLALKAFSHIAFNRKASDAARGPEAVAVNASMLRKFPREFCRHHFMMLGGDIAQRVSNGQLFFGLPQCGLAPWSAPDTLLKSRMIGERTG